VTTPANSNDVRLGLVGTGAMAAQMAQAAELLPRVGVSAVLSRSSDTAGSFCAAHAVGARASTDVAAFLDAVDAVYIATPLAHHMQYARAAIAAGKPVLCEKPLTGSVGETEALLAQARAQGVLAMEAIWTLALPAYLALKSRVEVSDATFLQFDFSYPLNAQEGSHYFDPETGGVLLDRSVYGYAVAVDLLGGVAEQSAFVTRRTDGLDVSAEIRLLHTSGARSLITLAFDRLGANALHVSTAQGLFSMGPSSLAMESLAFKPYPHLSPPTQIPSRPGLKDRLKSLPMLRKLRDRLPASRQTFSYGASSYAPILQEFLTALAQGRTQSALVPHPLSEEVCRLTAAARLQT
jgi:predicted dehydrogenase